VLIDAPCAATGTIRRHPDVAWLKQESDIGALAAVQKRMLQKAVTLLKPGGTLVYCTCSLEPEEGEQAVASILASDPACAVPRSAARKWPDWMKSSHPTATSAHCHRISRTPIRASAGSTASSRRVSSNPDPSRQVIRK
jgi:16S rRNA (cytosine967-C5)-methyltransferase